MTKSSSTHREASSPFLPRPDSGAGLPSSLGQAADPGAEEARDAEGFLRGVEVCCLHDSSFDSFMETLAST